MGSLLFGIYIKRKVSDLTINYTKEARRNIMFSHCIFCACRTPIKSGPTVEEQLKVNFILRKVLGFSNDKVNQLGGGTFQNNGQLHPQLEVQICSSCGDEVEKVIWLSNELARLSSGLKNRIYETRQENGEGLNSAWGQARLETLLMMTGGDQYQLYPFNDGYHDLQENVKPEGSCPPSEAAGRYVEEPDNSQEPRANSGASDQNQAEVDGGTSHAESFDDSVFEEKYGNVVTPIPDEAEENNSEEEPCSSRSNVLRRSTDTSVSSSRSLDSNYSQQMELDVSSDEEDHVDSDQSDSHNDKQRGGNKSISWRKRRRQPDGRYHCLFCSETFASSITRNSHSEIHLSELVCKVCSRRYSYSSSFIQHLRMKVCGEESYAKWRKNGGRSSWKQFLK